MKEGIAELERIKSSKCISGNDELILLVDKYIAFYKGDHDLQMKITGPIFYPEVVEGAARKKAMGYLADEALKDDSKKYLFKEGAEDKATEVFLKKAGTDSKMRKELEKPAKDKMSRLKPRFKELLNHFYETEEGKHSDFKIGLVADKRDYRLRIDRKEDVAIGEDKFSQIIKYHEGKYHEMRYRPILFKVNIALVAPIVLVLFIVGALFTAAAFEKHSARFFYPALLSLSVMAAIVLLEVSLVRLPEKRFVSLYWKYFLKLSDHSISVVSYSGTCPVCQGIIELKYSPIGWKGYRGKCSNNPNLHAYTFDHIALTGRSL